MVTIDWKDNLRHIITKEEVKMCWKVIAYISQQTRISPEITGTTAKGWRIAEELDIKPDILRKYIQLIRENNDTFFNGEYLVANRSGYYITSDKKIIDKFITKTHIMATSKLQQVEQGWRTLKILRKGKNASS